MGFGKVGKRSAFALGFLLQLGHGGRNNSASFADRKNLIGFDLLELFYFSRRGPLHFNKIDDLIFSQAKVKTQVALRHDAGTTVDFVHLDMLAGDDADARANSRAITLGSDQLDCDPVLLIAAVVAEKRRGIIHVQD